MVVEHNRRSIWRRPLRAPRDAPVGGRCGDMMELDGSKPTIDIRPHLSQHLHGIREQIWYYPVMRIHAMAWIQMRRISDDVYLPRGLTTMYSPSLIQAPLHLYLWTRAIAHWWCTWRPWSTELKDALGDRDLVNSEMHLESRIEWTQRSTPRPWSSEFGDALGSRDRVNS